MCRFLMLASPEAVDVRAIVGQFAQMCQRSTSPTGDRQADGWGVAWWLEGQEWHRHRSVEPIWTETQVIQRLPPTCHLVVHARSASFVQHKEQIAYNQPYIWGS